MCGIVGAVAQRNVTGILIEGLKRLEYRGYDSAGLSVIDKAGILQIRKNAGKVSNLVDNLAAVPAQGLLGIAHTRWATHGIPSEVNAHPHASSDIAVVHNGIIENHQELRDELQTLGYQFVSETDTEVVAHMVHHYMQSASSLKLAVQKTIERLEGAYALGVICTREPEVLIGARSGSPLVLGVGIEENFIASDQMALRQVTDRFIFLEEGDLVELRNSTFQITDASDRAVQREVVTLSGDTRWGLAVTADSAART